jgi:Tfp pilus assembly protein PilZ
MNSQRPKTSLTPPSGREQRRHPRVAVSAKVDISSGANFYVGTTRDLSLSGLFVETTAGVAVGMPIVLRLDLLGKASEIPAEVVWVLQDDAGHIAGAGVRFLELSEELRKRIEAFMVFRDPMDDVGENHDGGDPG